MESVYSSPNSTRTRNKENSRGGSECEDMISISSSTLGSSVNGSYTPKGKNRSNKKVLKNVRSIQRRVRTRSTEPLEDYLVDDSNSSPNYLKATSCSEGKKSSSPLSFQYSGSIFDSSEQNSHKSLQPRARNVGILLRKASFKPKRSSSNYSRVSEDVSENVPVVDRATYCSTLRDSKFPKPVIDSSMNVCRYQHCSLHGHCHSTDDSVPPPKRFVYKRRPLKKPNSMIHVSESAPGNRKKNDIDSYKELYENSETEQFENGYYNPKESEVLEIAYGETSFPERSYQENLNILRKYSSSEQEFGRSASGLNGYCLKCSCSIREQIMSPPQITDEISSGYTLSFKESKIGDKESYRNEGFDKDFPTTPVISDDVTEKSIGFSLDSVGKSTSGSSFEVDGEFTTESFPVKNSKESEETLVKDNNEGSKLQFSKQRHMSMWHLIHHRMSSDLTVVLNTPKEGVDGENQANKSLDIGIQSNDGSAEIQEMEIRKLFAIKLVREAIEKILLPEVQDQTSDDQSSTSDNSPRSDIIEKNQTDVSIGESYGESNADKREEGDVLDQKEGGLVTEKSRKSEKKAPKHWSNLKKWILLQRFIKELEKVRNFSPKKPNILSLNPDPEAEKVKLRAQSVDERKRSEEWMLDYALRQAVSQLAPTQKRKVALLVKAFETVAPSGEEEPQIHIKTHRTKDNGKEVINGTVSSLVSMLQESVESVDEKLGEVKLVEKMEERQDHMRMWHSIYQHVVTGIAEKVGSKLLEESDEEEVEENKSIQVNGDDEPRKEVHAFTKTDALKLVKEAVDEILLPETPGQGQISKNAAEPQNAKNWRKLKKHLLLQRSIKALENARKLKPKSGSLIPQKSDLEPEKVDLKNQMVDERKKAEQWMLDYAVQHIVTKLTPARKRRVAMLVEAFEAVVPLPET